MLCPSYLQSLGVQAGGVVKTTDDASNFVGSYLEVRVNGSVSQGTKDQKRRSVKLTGDTILPRRSLLRTGLTCKPLLAQITPSRPAMHAQVTNPVSTSCSSTYSCQDMFFFPGARSCVELGSIPRRSSSGPIVSKV